jgi:hypothetical protein
MRGTKRYRKYKKRLTLKRIRSTRVNKTYMSGGMYRRIFNLDLHSSVIEDIKTIFTKLYDTKFEITNWSISGHNTLFKKTDVDVKHINQATWKDINMDMIKKFHNEYDKILNDYDAFIVTHTPVFAMIYEKYNKPIIVINSCRYDQPFCWNNNTEMLNLFHESLRRMEKSGQLIMISNNMSDQLYLKERSGIDSIYIPSLCMYTNASFNKQHDEYIIFDGIVKDKFKSIPNSEILVERPSNYTFDQLFKYSGIVHMPYETSTMSIFEQYFAGMPLFFPSKDFFKVCIRNKYVDFIVRYDKWGTSLSDEEIEKWLKNADYYNFKYINYYESFEDCLNKLKVFKDTEKNNRIKHIDNLKNNTLDKWRGILNKTFKM